MFQPQLGVSIQTLATSITPEALQAIANSSIATLELFMPLLEKDAVPLLQQYLQNSPVRLMSIHARFGPAYDWSKLDQEAHASALGDLREALALAVTLGTPLVIAHASAEPIGEEERPRRLQRTIEALQEVSAECREAGIRIAIELLPRTCLGNTGQELLQILEPLDPQVFGVCLDVNHAMDRYASLPELIQSLGDRLITTHLSDYDGVDEKHWLPGQGVIDWPAVMGAWRAIGYQGPFNYECQLAGSSVEERIRTLEDNFRWLARQ